MEKVADVEFGAENETISTPSEPLSPLLFANPTNFNETKYTHWFDLSTCSGLTLDLSK